MAGNRMVGGAIIDLIFGLIRRLFKNPDDEP
jgi:hypothetical protein